MRGGSTGHWQTTFRSSSVYRLISKESSRSRRALPRDSGVSKLIIRHEMELVQQSEGGNGHSFHAGYGVAVTPVMTAPLLSIGNCAHKR
jgi:hypothetical protein